MNFEYKIKVIDYPSKSEDYEDGIIKVMRDVNGVDRSLIFTCHNSCRCKIYIPLGDDNNEGGSGTRQLIWNEKDKILSIEPSILITGGCRAHYYIRKNKVEM